MIAVNIALIIIHVSLIFLNNSWNHLTDTVFCFIRISLDKKSSNSYEVHKKSRLCVNRGLIKCHTCVCGRGGPHWGSLARPSNSVFISRYEN